MYSQERAICRTGLWPACGSWTLSPWNVQPGKSIIVYLRHWAMLYQFAQKIYTHNVICGELLFFLRAEIWIAETYVTDTQEKSWIPRLGQHSWLAAHVLSHTVAMRIKCTPCDVTREYTWSLNLGLPDFLPPHVPFLFADFNLHPFAVVIHSHEHNSFWFLWVFLVNHQAWESS